MLKLFLLPLATIALGSFVGGLSSPSFLQKYPANQLVITNKPKETASEHIEKSVDGEKVQYSVFDINVNADYVAAYTDVHITPNSLSNQLKTSTKKTITPVAYNINKNKIISGRMPTNYFECAVSSDLLPKYDFPVDDPYLSVDTISFIGFGFNITGVIDGTNTIMFSNAFYNFGDYYYNSAIKLMIDFGYYDFTLYPDGSETDGEKIQLTSSQIDNSIPVGCNDTSVLYLPESYENIDVKPVIKYKDTVLVSEEKGEEFYIDNFKVMYGSDTIKLGLSPEEANRILSRSPNAPYDKTLLVYSDKDDMVKDKKLLQENNFEVEEVPVDGTYIGTDTLAVTLSTLLFTIYNIGLACYLSLENTAKTSKFAQLAIGIVSVIVNLVLFPCILFIGGPMYGIQLIITSIAFSLSMISSVTTLTLILFKKKAKEKEADKQLSIS